MKKCDENFLFKTPKSLRKYEIMNKNKKSNCDKT